MRKPLERDVLKACLEYLGVVRGWPCWRNNTGAAKIGGGVGVKARFIRFGVPGSSDILGVIPPAGRLLAVETKREGGRVRPSQETFLARVREAGGLSLVVDSLDSLRRQLAEAGYGEGS